MIPFYNSSGSSFFSSFSSSFERSKSFPIFSAFLALVSIKSKEFSDMMSISIACSLTSEMRYIKNVIAKNTNGAASQMEYHSKEESNSPIQNKTAIAQLHKKNKREGIAMIVLNFVIRLLTVLNFRKKMTSGNNMTSTYIINIQTGFPLNLKRKTSQIISIISI